MVEEKHTIIIYEKEINLNMILNEQISKSGNYQIYTITNHIELFHLLGTIKLNVLILNLNNLDEELKSTIKSYKIQKKIDYIIGYHNKDYIHLGVNEEDITFLKKPFKIINLINELEKLLNSKSPKSTNIFLMGHLKFSPFERVLYNLKTENKERLTEKENKLLVYFYSNINIEITKNDLLNTIWGMSENINTHTLETHMYRLKQKLNKLEPNLSFSLSSQNGLYSMRFDNMLSS